MTDCVKQTATFMPGLSVDDPGTAKALKKVTLRLRREVAWCWHQRTGATPAEPGKLPPLSDSCLDSLDLIRFVSHKNRFFQDDTCAAYLSQELEHLNADAPEEQLNHSWEWVCRNLKLDQASQFVLALALATHADSAFGPVCASCNNDLGKPFPTAALAQRLWDHPNEIIPCFEPDHVLFSSGLLHPIAGSAVGFWNQAICIEASAAQCLLSRKPRTPNALQKVSATSVEVRRAIEGVVVGQLKGTRPKALQLVPMVGPLGTDFEKCAVRIQGGQHHPLYSAKAGVPWNDGTLRSLLVWCWIQGADLYLPAGKLRRDIEAGGISLCASIPVRCFIGQDDAEDLSAVDQDLLGPSVSIPSTSYFERVELIEDQLGSICKPWNGVVEDVARRFRLQDAELAKVCQVARDSAITEPELLNSLCRNAAPFEFGSLAERIQPRFTIDELILPKDQKAHFLEISSAMNMLGRVHYQWGTAKTFKESGLSAMFYGPSGTGKTMGAEVLANLLNLPLFRIDLSMVVNKYIGETEKNLRRVFAAAERADCILFFDEADALFGKRTSVKDAHDRFANIEISYLLARMESFKGLSILATNRKSDLDSAFLRRLHTIVEFPLPEKAEREHIWRRCFPSEVDCSDLDFAYLAKQFHFSGGNIRSIAFNACLMAAASGTERSLLSGYKGKVAMDHVLQATRRELQKLERPIRLKDFGEYSSVLEEVLR